MRTPFRNRLPDGRSSRLLAFAALAAALLSCEKQGEVVVDDTPVVTVLYDAQALGDRSYNDLIYSGVERAAAAYGLKTIHYSPQTLADGKQLLQKTITEMASARDGVKRLLIVASETYDATVAGNKGIILLPDGFIDPLKNGGSSAFVNGNTTGYDSNYYSADDWTIMEQSGCVFLPAAGFRFVNEYINDSGDFGSYWTSTLTDTNASATLSFQNNQVNGNVTMVNYRGQSVRIVRDLE